jgi:cobalt-zinc-cadmium efflux system outer membrane protein
MNPAPQPLTLGEAVAWGLQNNPELAAFRQQRGVATAAVVIARTYPYNPQAVTRLTGVTGPESAGITNVLAMQYSVMFQIELHGQAAYRRQVACAALSRTDWEIASLEVALAVRVAKAFQGVLYRRAKLRLVEETVRLNQEAATQVQRLAEAGKLRGVDLILSRSEVDDARAQLGAARVALETARAELQRSLGAVGGLPAEPGGDLAMPSPLEDVSGLLQTALDRRADLRAKQAAVAEAQARLLLMVADRLGNPSIGPFYELNETRSNFIGANINFPLPVWNRRQGEIRQLEALRVKAQLDVRNVEVMVRQDVETAMARLGQARAGARIYETDVLPHLRAGLDNVQKLFLQGEPGVDTLRVIDVRRRFIKARDGYLDVIWNVSQIQADLALAVGDPAVAVAPYSAPETAPPPTAKH